MEQLREITPARAAYLRVAFGLTGDPATLTLLAQRCVYNVAQAEQPVPQRVNDLTRFILTTPPRLRLTMHTLPGATQSTFQTQTVSGTLHLLGTEQRYAIPLVELQRSEASEALRALDAALDPASPGALSETKCHFAGIERRELRPDQRTVYEYAGNAELALAYRPTLVVGTIVLCVLHMVRSLEISDAATFTLLQEATDVLRGDPDVRCHGHAPSNAYTQRELKEVALLLAAYFERRQSLEELYETLRQWRLRYLHDMLPLLDSARTVLVADQ